MLQTASHWCLIQVKQLIATSIETISVVEDNKKSAPVTQMDPKKLQSFEKKYANVLKEPLLLPPHRGRFDHKISLAPREGPVNIRP